MAKQTKRAKAARAKAARAMWKRRKAKALQSIFPGLTGDKPIGAQLRVRLPEDYQVQNTPLHIKMNGLIDRMTQAIDKIQAQIERLETL